MRTCELYRERRKTCEPFTALTVVITEKFTGNGESGGNAHSQIRAQALNDQLNIHTHTRLFTASNKPHRIMLPGKSWLVGALSWIFLSILKERSVSSCPCLLVHSPDSNDTPSMSSDSSRIFRTSMGSAAKRQKQQYGWEDWWVQSAVAQSTSFNVYCPFRPESDLHRSLKNHTLVSSDLLCFLKFILLLQLDKTKVICKLGAFLKQFQPLFKQSMLYFTRYW